RDRAIAPEDRGGRAQPSRNFRNRERVPLGRVRRAPTPRGGTALPPEGSAVPGALSPVLDRGDRRALGAPGPSARRPAAAAHPLRAHALRLTDAAAGHPV